MSRPFVPLHVHSHASILHATSKIGDLITVAKANDMPAMALTDMGVMHGAVDFYQKAHAAGIKPILGCEVYVVDGDPTEKVTKRHAYHLILLAQNNTGYQNLVKLVSKAHLEGFYYKPRISWEQLRESSEGLITLTACMSGPIGHPVLRNNPQEAYDRVKWLKDTFDDRLYLEMTDHGIEGERKLNAEVLKLSQSLDLPIVVSNHTHYTRAEDAKVHDILLCMQMGKLLNDPSRFRFASPTFYLKNGDEMAQSFPGMEQRIIDQAIETTLAVAERCNVTLELGKAILPDYPVPEGHNTESYLKELVHRFAEDRFPTVDDTVRNRLEMELGVINQMGFPAYFLIVWDFIHYARQNHIPVGPGRGSAAGSAVAFALGITDIDPIEHNLLFERFLNPERISMPDIDIDFCIDKREKVIQYVTDLYGQERVAQIVTFGTLAARAAVKAVCRVMDIPFAESDKLAKMIPSVPGTKLKDALEEGMELGKLAESDPQVREIVDLALLLEGTNANTGVHAAGVVISKDPLDNIVPLMNAKEGGVVTQYSMDDVANLGLLKMDFLGLRNLTIMDKTARLVEKVHHQPIHLDRLPLDDAEIYQMLTAGQTDGVFQLESGGMKALVRELKPSTFEDINALVALFRPGPLNSGMVEEFVKRKHGKSKVEYVHPDLEPILKDTYGTIVYQEQIMQIAQKLAGYSLGQADLLRRAMGKKKESEMLKQRELFLNGASAHQVPEGIANKLFDDMTEFAKYCFNRSHSAAYAYVAYQTAWLKVHYPVEYLSAVLSSVSSDLDKIQQYILTARAMGIQVLPPDINTSDADFTPVEGNIRFGLASIKNVGDGIVERMIEARSDKPFESIEDLLNRVDIKTLNRRTFESLIYAGALDSFGRSRQQLIENLDLIYSYGQRQAEQKETGQVSLFSALGSESGEAYQEQIQWQGFPDEYPPETIQKYEKELLGTYVSSHPLDELLDTLPTVATATTQELGDLKDGSNVIIAGLVTSCLQKLTRTNKPMRIGQLEDLTGSVEFVAFSDSIGAYDVLLQEGQKISISGKLQFRGDDAYSVIVNGVRPLEEVSVLSLTFKRVPKFEEIDYLRSVLAQVKGLDPVVVTFADKTRMVLGQQFWVNYSAAYQTLQPMLSNGLGNLLELSNVRSLPSTKQPVGNLS